jgi:hypothetical protein
MVHVLHGQLCSAWRARKRADPISPAMHLASKGLILGVGTIVVAAEGPRQSLQGQETLVLALSSAAYGNAVAPSVVDNITRAAKASSEGDDCLAYIHLAHARIAFPQRRRHRLYLLHKKLIRKDDFLYQSATNNSRRVNR